MIVLPVPGGPNNRYGVGRHWPLTIRETAALWRSFRDVLYKKSSGLCLLEDSALLSLKGVPLIKKYINKEKHAQVILGHHHRGCSTAMINHIIFASVYAVRKYDLTFIQL